MGRSEKYGLSYYPFDIDFFQDLKIRKLIKYQGGKAVTVYALLLCLIYKGGYYMMWDEELPFIISEQTGFEEAYILEVIKSCLALGLFSKEAFDNHRILTSKGIQERYQSISKSIRRITKMEEYNLISSEEKKISSAKTHISSEEKRVSSEEKPISSEKTPVSSDRIEENRKEIKENSTKVEPKKSPAEKLSAAQAAAQTRKEKFYNELIPYVERYGSQMVRAFYDYWSELNKSKTQMRFEKETTWETERRLSYWEKREKMQTTKKANITNHDNRKTYHEF